MGNKILNGLLTPDIGEPLLEWVEKVFFSFQQDKQTHGVNLGHVWEIF